MMVICVYRFADTGPWIGPLLDIDVQSLSILTIR